MSFEKISKSTYVNFYIMEIWAISESIIVLKGRLFNTNTYKQIKEQSESNTLDSSSEPHEIVSSILNHSARLHKLFHSSSQRDAETGEEYSFRKERSEYLRKLLLPKKKNAHEIFKAGVRNGIEHFDERIDLMNSKILDKDVAINEKALLYNMTLSSKRVFGNWNEVLPIKVYIVDTNEYFMTNHLFEEQVINLNNIFEESLKIHEKCQKWGEKIKDENGKIIDGTAGILKTPKHEF
jgi:hypothetical protein